MNNPNYGPRGDISNKALAIGSIILAPAAIFSLNQIHQSAEEHPPTSSYEQVKHDLESKPRSAEPVEVSGMPAAQLPNMDMNNTVKVELPPVEQ